MSMLNTTLDEISGKRNKHLERACYLQSQNLFEKMFKLHFFYSIIMEQKFLIIYYIIVTLCLTFCSKAALAAFS